MDRLKIVAHARDYMEKLSNGVNPIDGSPMDQPDALRRCYAFVKDILSEIVRNGGYIDPGEGFEVVKKKAPFALTTEQRAAVPIAQIPITEKALLVSINAQIDNTQMEKFTSKRLNSWLVAQGYLKEVKIPSTIHRTHRNPTPASRAIGIDMQQFTDPQTGELKWRMIYSPKAQTFILEHLQEMN